jgi:LmbE family N-acetylglucosaminyl deacetylase
MKTALVIAAHPDDEVLGFGATIARMTEEGWQVHVFIAAEGITGRSKERNQWPSRDALEDLNKSAMAANKILGSSSLQLNSLPDNRMDSVALLDIVKLLELEIERYKPSIVFTHHSGDVNIDHRILHDAVIAACRPQPGHPVKTLLFFEIPSSTEWRPASSQIYFAPNCYYDVTNYLEKNSML